MYKKIFKKKKMVGVALVLIMLTYVYASSSVYAKNSGSIPTVEETIVTPVEEELAANECLAVEQLQADESSIIEPIPLPLVQSMTQAQASPTSLYQDTEYDSFFEHTVFVGDSLTVGFSNYCENHSNTIATDTTYFLAKTSCSAQIALSSKALTTHADVMPSYNGKVQYIEDSISQMTDVEKVFICFGMNDLVTSTPSQYVSNMETLIERILTKSPQVSIYVISIPCIIETVQSGQLSNDSIQAANSLMQTTCETKGWGFVNLAEYLMNAQMAIYPEYSSDGYVHENSSAYAIWIKVLRNYAYKDMTL